jgi:iron complex transport system permease protein
MTILILMPLLAFFLSLCIGRYQIEAGRTASILFSAIAHIKQAGLELEQSIVLDIRLPRALLAMMVGAGLAVSGAAFQGLFGNPLVSPHILGGVFGSGFWRGYGHTPVRSSGRGAASGFVIRYFGSNGNLYDQPA